MLEKCMVSNTEGVYGVFCFENLNSLRSGFGQNKKHLIKIENYYTIKCIKMKNIIIKYMIMDKVYYVIYF